MSEHTHENPNFKSFDSRPEDLKFTISEIINGFSTRSDIENFLEKNKVFSFENEKKLNQFIWRNELSKRLSSFNVDIEDFDKFLVKHNLKLTGSFLLQVISGKEFKDYDIDIYTENITTQLKNDLINLFHTANEPQIGNNKDPKYMEQIVQEIQTFFVPNVFKTHKKIEPLKIQLIKTINKYQGIDAYLDTFDFNILQNYYDGITFNVRSLENIKNNVAIYNEKFFGVRSFLWIVRRIKKYHNRGYVIVFGLNFLSHAQKIKMTKENLHYYPYAKFEKNDIDPESGFDFLMNQLVR